MEQFNTPILFIIFNRFDTAERVFDVIRQIKPKYLFVAADGARKDRKDDIENCQKTRDIIKKIDWDCELKTLFREENLGCGKAVSGAITWFFDNVEKGIILEDDCLPHQDFFYYCEDLLGRYKNEDKIKAICGNNNEIESKKTDASYYYSAYHHVWGWASWARVWKDYHYDVNDFPKKYIYDKINNYFDTIGERLYWKNRYQIVASPKVMRKRKINAWDYQSTFSIWDKDGLSILPQKCLITNIGFGEGATHTQGDDRFFLNHPILPLRYNDNIVQDKCADKIYYRKHIYKPLWKYPLLWLKVFLEKLL